ncbi:hypothetical protein [Micromonospora sp. ATA51]|uniref:hypothetical protein n=1 Tax=Micromonospora sp. ATA51 TaxID=2806098 RepID=UPI001EE3AD44|nr:hypothetical protein [Micromonospora sp. ATA51]
MSLLGVAVLGAFLLRRRGLTLGGSVDPLLVSVPVLVAIAAALLALRAYPWPLRLLSRAAARARGSVAFLGTARAGRAAATAPLVVVVLAVATAAFCGVVAAGIEAGRDRAASRAVPGDVLVDGERFAPDTTAALAGLPGCARSPRCWWSRPSARTPTPPAGSAAWGRPASCWSTAPPSRRWAAAPV